MLVLSIELQAMTKGRDSTLDPSSRHGRVSHPHGRVLDMTTTPDPTPTPGTMEDPPAAPPETTPPETPVAPPTAGTDVALPQPAELHLPAVIGPPSPAEWSAMQAQVNALAHSNLIPSNLRGKPDDVMVILLTGRELYVAPMMALSRIHVIEGKPTMSAELMGALVMRAGHSMRVIDGDGSCTVIARRKNEQETSEFRYSMDDAKTAGLLSKKPWQQHPRSMLRARAISSACRAVFPDVLMGVSYTSEELGAEVDPFTGQVDLPPAELITEGDRAAIMERINALNDASKDQLRASMREARMNLRHLPVHQHPVLLDMLDELEDWEPATAPTAPGDDSTAAEATVVGDSPDGDPETCDACGEWVTAHLPGCPNDVVDADVVEDPEPAKKSGDKKTGSRPQDVVVADEVPQGDVALPLDTSPMT